MWRFFIPITLTNSLERKTMFNQRLKQLREINSLTQKQVADILGITRSSYAYYELGKSHPGIEGLKILAKLYNVSLDFLLDYNDTGDDVKYRLNDNSIDYISDKQPNFISDLTSEEKDLIIYFRIFDDEKKKKVMDMIKELNNE